HHSMSLLFAVLYYFYLSCSSHHLYLHSFPTRRSSDLAADSAPVRRARRDPLPAERDAAAGRPPARGNDRPRRPARGLSGVFLAGDRKSTRLNSSHLGISYAVFCLKKKITKVYGTEP